MDGCTVIITQASTVNNQSISSLASKSDSEISIFAFLRCKCKYFCHIRFLEFPGQRTYVLLCFILITEAITAHRKNALYFNISVRSWEIAAKSLVCVFAELHEIGVSMCAHAHTTEFLLLLFLLQRKREREGQGRRGGGRRSSKQTETSSCLQLASLP